MTDFAGESIVLDSDDAKYSAANSEYLIKKYAAFYNNLVRSLKQPIGTIRKSVLSELDFQAENGTNWVLCDGQDITGTAFASIRGVTTAPEMVTAYSFITQIGDNADLYAQIEDDVEAHRHAIVHQTAKANGTTRWGNSAIGWHLSNRPRFGGDDPFFYGNEGAEPSICTTQTVGDSESMLYSTKCNYFLKVDND